MTAIRIPGTMNDKLQSLSTYSPAIREPRIFPIDVCEFQRPNIIPARRTKLSNLIPDWKLHGFQHIVYLNMKQPPLKI